MAKAARKTTTTKKAPTKKATKKAGRKKAATKKTAGRKEASKKAGRKKTGSKKSAPRKWSRRVNQTSDAMDLQEGVFKGNDPRKIALSIKRSATKSNRKKAGPYQSAMSMLNFYINRGGKNLSSSEKKTLEKAKEELKNLFGRE